jgi:signal peptidase I
MKKLKKVYLLLNTIFNLALLAVLILTAFLYYLSTADRTPWDLKPFVISSGSMGDTIPAGSLALAQPRETYHPDDIITYYTNDQNGNRQKTPTTHRIVEVVEGENLGYRTKGDANQDPDPFITPHQNLIGKVVFHLPFFGHFNNFARSQLGLIILIVIPATLIIYQQLQNIHAEILKILDKKTKK